MRISDWSSDVCSSDLMSFFTSTTTPSGGSVKRDPPYASSDRTCVSARTCADDADPCDDPNAASAARTCSENGRHLVGLAVEIRRGLQPLLVGVPGEHELAALEAIDHHPRHLRPYRRAALAAADAALGGDPGRIHVSRRVDDDGALAGAVIDTRIQSEIGR